MEDMCHSQASAFFAQQKNYQRFEQYLHHNQIDARKVPFTELSFKVCGYGYFEKYKQHMKLKFREYLWQSTNACVDLNTLKIIFNGFKVNAENQEREQAQQIKMQEEHILLDLIQSVEEIVRKRKLKVFHFHTTNLRKCSQKDLVRLFGLISLLGSQESCEEVSVQMADWEFQGGYPEYQRLVQIFTGFVQDKPENLRFKKFRLEMSSWYMKEKQAYKLLSKTLTKEQLVQRFKRQQKPLPKDTALKPKEEESQAVVEQTQNHQNLQFPNLTEEKRAQTLQALDYFLQNMDLRYSKPKYPHKKTSQKYNEQQFLAHQSMLAQMQRTQQIVSQRLIKYPFQFIQGCRVQQFHNSMVQFLGNLLTKMSILQQYHIDMRNWNGMFSMGALKKILDTKVVSNKLEFSLIRRSLISGGAAGVGKAGEEVKTVYTM